MRDTLRAVLAAAALALGMVAPSQVRAEEVDLLLALAADVSRSVDSQKFQLQRDGYAAALQDPRVVAAITGGTLGRIAVSYIEWSGAGNQKVVIDWTVVRDADSAGKFATQLLESSRAFADRTSISGGIDFAAVQFERAPMTARRRTIDVSGDGTNNSGRDVTAARDEAVAKGISINGLVILTEQPLSWNAEHTNPAGGLEAYFRNNVIGGPGAFVLTAQDFNAFGQAMISKLVAEIAAASPPSRAAAVVAPRPDASRD
ncbi:hypothetical protein CH341_27655 [Rhodoplanes roseus]|uniref:VWFA domain-containing protein n=2 Tax=Rhodoplanes roseus TaxID=29409 RepID=A0A327KLZ7_9BRAD|nr:hypothetical protein CH341_27655 [Rhodoplanes roseus]